MSSFKIALLIGALVPVTAQRNVHIVDTVSCLLTGNGNCTNVTSISTEGCSQASACTDSFLVCGDDSPNCNMNCNAPSTCIGSHMECHSSGQCAVHCNFPNACQFMNGLNMTNSTNNTNAGYFNASDFGIFMGENAKGTIHCNAVDSCTNTSIGCAADSCVFECNQERSCSGTSLAAFETTEDVVVNCAAGHVCSNSNMDFSEVDGKAVITCGSSNSCSGATIRCPKDGDCLLRCTSENACKDVDFRCGSGSCEVECNSNSACGNLQTCGGARLNCNANGCTSVNQTADCPTPAPVVSGCPSGNWRLKFLSTIDTNCSEVCNTITGNSSTICDAVCECVPEPTLEPVIVPTLQPVPTGDCPGGNWKLRFANAIDANCSMLCDTVTGNSSVCSTLCECVPITPEPNVVVIRETVLEVLLGILFPLFDQDIFTTLMLTLLDSMATNITINWICPSTVCIGGCPVAAIDKEVAGCESVIDPINARLASLLQSEESTVVQFTPTYTAEGSPEAASEKLNSDIANNDPAAQQLQLKSSDVKDSEVRALATDEQTTIDVKDNGDNDDGLNGGYIALIVVVALLFIVGVAALVFFMLRKKSVSKARELQHSEKEPTVV